MRKYTDMCFSSGVRRRFAGAAIGAVIFLVAFAGAAAAQNRGVGDVGVSLLAGGPGGARLESLNVSYTRATDACLPWLMRMQARAAAARPAAARDSDGALAARTATADARPGPPAGDVGHRLSR